MLNLTLKVNKLRKISFYLFIVPSIAIVFSLLFHNLLISYKFKEDQIPSEIKYPYKIKCNKDNNFCFEFYKNFKDWKQFKNLEDLAIKRISDCRLYKEDLLIIKNNKEIIYSNYLSDHFDNGKFDTKYIDNDISLVLDDKYWREKQVKSKTCIKNSKLFNFYKIFPYPFNLLSKIIGNDYNPPSVNKVNPFLYGELSISALVRNYPVNFIFKPLLYIASILMIIYWLSYQKIFSKITNKEKKDIFFYCGIGSSIFLFLHIFFLGSGIDNELFKKFRRFIIIMFILSELLAQFFLVKKIILIRNLLKNYTFEKVIIAKIVFVSIILFITFLVIVAMIIYDLPSYTNNIIEWNYFLILLIFYFLSYIMWKKS